MNSHPFEGNVAYIARRLCVIMGIDPDRRVQAMQWANMTRYEQANSPPPYYDVPESVPAWCLLRRDAELIVASRELNRELDAEIVTTYDPQDRVRVA